MGFCQSIFNMRVDNFQFANPPSLPQKIKGAPVGAPFAVSYLHISVATSTMWSQLRPNCFSSATAGPE